jgi:hypothetical protein
MKKLWWIAFIAILFPVLQVQASASEFQKAQWANERAKIAAERAKRHQVPRCSHGGSGCYRNGKHTCACE